MLMLNIIHWNAQFAKIQFNSNKTNLFSSVNKDSLMTKESLKISFLRKCRKRRNSSMKKFQNEWRSNFLSRLTKKSSKRLLKRTMDKFSGNGMTKSLHYGWKRFKRLTKSWRSWKRSSSLTQMKKWTIMSIRRRNTCGS
jgi:ADP-heptose:LPS heptosyltransferase